MRKFEIMFVYAGTSGFSVFFMATTLPAKDGIYGSPLSQELLLLVRKRKL